MDFTKFVSMLETRSLFFASSDQLGDPFEGSTSKANYTLRPVVYRKMLEPIRDKIGDAAFATAVESFSNAHASGASFRKWERQWTFINCWHMNTGESAAMWRLYSKSNEAIAIRSSFSSLANELGKGMYVGVVNYIDYEQDWIPEGNGFYPFVHKRKSFSHECEVRAVFLKPPIDLENKTVDFDKRPPNGGVPIPVDLTKLVHEVYVAPTCPAWFHELVTQVCERYALDKKVRQSSLSTEPSF